MYIGEVCTCNPSYKDVNVYLKIGSISQRQKAIMLCYTDTLHSIKFGIYVGIMRL